MLCEFQLRITKLHSGRGGKNLGGIFGAIFRQRTPTISAQNNVARITQSTGARNKNATATVDSGGWAALPFL
jgi:hypothetical protein